MRQTAGLRYASCELGRFKLLGNSLPFLPTTDKRISFFRDEVRTSDSNVKPSVATRVLVREDLDVVNKRIQKVAEH